MSMSAFLERVFLGKAAIERSRRSIAALGEEREALRRKQTQLQGEVRQYEQVVNSSSKLMDTMTQAMIMVEAGRGSKRKT